MSGQGAAGQRGASGRNWGHHHEPVNFLHRDANAPTTISEIRRLHGEIVTTDFLGLYAYATQSGAALFDLDLGGDSGRRRLRDGSSAWTTAEPSRRLFGCCARGRT